MANHPDPNVIHPDPEIESIVYIKNVITRPNIYIGDYTYYEDPVDAENFEKHVTHHYESLGDKLIIGKFCVIERDVEFIMNGANHRLIKREPSIENILIGVRAENITAGDLPFFGDTVVGNDVWIGHNVKIMPGVHIGNGAVIESNTIVDKHVPDYYVVSGKPCAAVRQRYSPEVVDFLRRLEWWDWPDDMIFDNLEIICSGNIEKMKEIEII